VTQGPWKQRIAEGPGNFFSLRTGERICCEIFLQRLPELNAYVLCGFRL
jgi:hypothetical protein